MTFCRNNVGLESLGFLPCMAKGETNAQQCAFPVKPRYLSYLFLRIELKCSKFLQKPRQIAFEKYVTARLWQKLSRLLQKFTTYPGCLAMYKYRMTISGFDREKPWVVPILSFFYDQWKFTCLEKKISDKKIVKSVENAINTPYQVSGRNDFVKKVQFVDSDCFKCKILTVVLVRGWEKSTTFDLE